MSKDPFPHLPEDGRGGSIWLTLRNYLLAGIAVATPLTITAWLVITVISLFDRIFKPLVPSVYNPETYLPFAIPGLGLVFALIFLTMLGAIAANILGRTAIGWGERILGRLPRSGTSMAQSNRSSTPLSASASGRFRTWR